MFYGCSGYPECTQSFWNKPVNKKCPECGSLLVEKKTKGTVSMLQQRMQLQGIGGSLYGTVSCNDYRGGKARQ
ncbi:MAG: topoisomerase DNA-binding C4 zinc finger domain-containing protein [Anaerovoracaceae bacterium]